jgi:hypothetical protein
VKGYFCRFPQERSLPYPGEAEPGHDIVEDAHGRERVGPLEHHPNPAPHELSWRTGRINVQVAELYPTLHAAAKMVVETVDGPEESRFAATRGPDQSGHLQRGHVEVDPTHGDVVAEADRDVLET